MAPATPNTLVPPQHPSDPHTPGDHMIPMTPNTLVPPHDPSDPIPLVTPYGLDDLLPIPLVTI